jgi:hypothetical protein
MDEDGYFGEPVAARYDQSVSDMTGAVASTGRSPSGMCGPPSLT